jgi:formylglycine-generating enzyme required for sulfatase activity
MVHLRQLMSITRPRLVIGIASLTLLFSGGCKCGSTAIHTQNRRHGGTWGGTAASCKGLAATCGPAGNEDCCKSLSIPGGTFCRSHDGIDHVDKSYPATVSDFYLDKYEVTVGRFRMFVKAGMGTQKSPPREGAGAHPKIAGSGWRTEWNSKLAVDTTALKAATKCYASYQTWTDEPGSNENKPQNCLDWFTAFAFCAWDGGRLASEAEWNYAASGGAEQRYYPWSNPPNSTVIDESYAAYCGGACLSPLNVGAKSPKGDGKWGQSDLGGNAWEWTLDWNSAAFPMPCHDCAVVDGGTYRNFRSGAFDDLATTLRSATRHVFNPEYHGIVGARCARSP